MRVKIHLNKLLLKSKFSISHGQYDHRNQLIVELQEGEHQGFGETIAIDYYGVLIEPLAKQAQFVARKVEKFHCEEHPKTFYAKLLMLVPENSFLRSAFDQAYWDLFARKNNSSIRELAEIQQSDEVYSSITIGLSDSDKSIDKKLSEAWPIFKVKVSAAAGKDHIKLIAQHGRNFGIDANAALDLGQAQKIIELVSELGASYVEQLVSKNFTKEIQRLKLPNGLPHLADEAIASLANAQQFSEYYDGFVLKLTKCGGITPVLEISDFAKREGKLLLAGCMTESSIGINHMLQLLPLFDFADLDGAYLISNDEKVTSIDSQPKRILQNDGSFT